MKINIKKILGNGLLTIVGVLSFAYMLYYVISMMRTEKYDTRIEQNEVEYTEKLDKKIDVVKKEEPVDLNKDKSKKKGWWNDVINCQNNGDMGIYCKPIKKWIFPY